MDIAFLIYIALIHILIFEINANLIWVWDDEGIKDTLLDLHNYAAMALMLIDEKE